MTRTPNSGDAAEPLGDIHVPRRAGVTLTDVSHYQRYLLDKFLESLPEQSAYDAAWRSWFRMAGVVNQYAVTFGEQMLAMGRHYMPSRETVREAFMQSGLLSSPSMARWMDYVGRVSTERDALHDDERNDKLYTHNHHGSLNRVTSDNILPLFEKGKTWPQLILTANHALTRDGNDMSRLMKNISAMARHTLDDHGIAFDLARHPEAVDEAGGKTVILGAVHAEGNWHLNAAALLKRYNYLELHTGIEERMRSQGDSKQPDYAGPALNSIRLAKLILRLMVVDKEAISLDDELSTAEKIARGDMPKAPLVLRDDAVEIARHITLIGYSKAATTVRDVQRYLAYELTATDAEGKPIFSMQDAKGRTVSLDKARIKEIFEAISPSIGVGGAEFAATEEEKALGIGQIRINSKIDLVSGHFLRREARRYGAATPNDAVYYVEGKPEGGGHDPNQALGFELEEGYLQADAGAKKLIGDILMRAYPQMRGAGSVRGALNLS